MFKKSFTHWLQYQMHYHPAFDRVHRLLMTLCYTPSRQLESVVLTNGDVVMRYRFDMWVPLIFWLEVWVLYPVLITVVFLLTYAGIDILAYSVVGFLLLNAVMLGGIHEILSNDTIDPTYLAWLESAYKKS